MGSNAISKQEYDDIVAQVKLAEADVAATQAEVRNAEINLGYSTVRAPISGQTNRSTVTAGALVTASQAEPLVTISALRPNLCRHQSVKRRITSFTSAIESRQFKQQQQHQSEVKT